MGKEGARVGGGVITHKAEDLAEKVHQGSRNDEGPGSLHCPGEVCSGCGCVLKAEGRCS